jgi:hypothetical protein
MGISDPHVYLEPEVPSRNFFTPLSSVEMEADHGDDVEYTTEHLQLQAPSSQTGTLTPIVPTSQVNLIQF